jgi:hypothetical protein
MLFACLAKEYQFIKKESNAKKQARTKRVRSTLLTLLTLARELNLVFFSDLMRKVESQDLTLYS